MTYPGTKPRVQSAIESSLISRVTELEKERDELQQRLKDLAPSLSGTLPEQKDSVFERIVRFEPAFDKRTNNPRTNYGIHGVDLLMLLRGPLGAVQFRLFTNWQLPHITQETHERTLNSPRLNLTSLHCSYDPMPADLGYHSPKPLYDEQTEQPCDYLPGGACYYDGSTLNAEPIYETLLHKGSDGVWQALEKYYRETFVLRAADAKD